MAYHNASATHMIPIMDVLKSTQVVSSNNSITLIKHVNCSIVWLIVLYVDKRLEDNDVAELARTCLLFIILVYHVIYIISKPLTFEIEVTILKIQM